MSLQDRLSLKWWGFVFRATGNLADYYEFLGHMLMSSQGGRPLRQIFSDDADRYGGYTARGELSARWARRFDPAGGDLAKIFEGSVPDEDRVLISAAQRAGGGALEQSLFDLARVSRLISECLSGFARATIVSVFMLIFAVVGLAAVPIFTVPQLKQSFTLDEIYLGGLTRALYKTADLIAAFGFPVAIGLAIAIVVTGWSLSQGSGPVRRSLDSRFVWKIYRDFNAVRFILAVASILKQRGGKSIQLREAIELQMQHSSPWLRSHLQDMIVNLRAGRVGIETFDTGLLDREIVWYMQDLVQSTNLDNALQRSSKYLETVILKKVQRSAALFSIFLAALSLACLIGLFIWHYGVVFEMRAAMQASFFGR